MSILRLLTETSKIRLAIVAVICILIFYAVGIATNLFASPAFSMFWIISAETARGVVLYVATALAIVLGAGMATFFWLKKRGSENSNSLDNLVLAVDKSKTESVDSYDSATFKMAAEEEKIMRKTKSCPAICSLSKSQLLAAPQLPPERLF